MEENNSAFMHLNSSNFTQEFDFSFYTKITIAAIVVQIIECVMMNVTNVALVFILLTSSPLKRPLRNGMLGAVTVANLVTGLFVVPLVVDPMIHRRYRQVCLAQRIAYEFFLYGENCVQLWTLLLLLLHHLAQLLGWKMPPAWWNSGRLSLYLMRAAGCLYVLFPWLVAAFVVAPVINSLTDFRKYLYCYIGLLHPHHELTLKVMTCFLPATLIVVLGAALAALTLTRGKEWRRSTAALTSQSSQAAEAVNTSRLSLTPDDDNDVLGPDPTYVHVLVGLTTVLLLLPGHAFALIGPAGYGNSRQYIIIIYCFYLVNDLAPTVQALLWLLLLPDLRTRLQQIWAAISGRLLCKRESPPLPTSGGAVPTVRFTTLREEE